MAFTFLSVEGGFDGWGGGRGGVGGVGLTTSLDAGQNQGLIPSSSSSSSLTANADGFGSVSGFASSSSSSTQAYGSASDFSLVNGDAGVIFASDWFEASLER